MIGIVGGVGPLAGLDVFKKITDETKACSDQEHASVILFSLPGNIPDRTRFLLGEEHINPAYALSKILFDLEKAGADVAGIPCNTAHAPQIFEVIEQELKDSGSKIILLHMLEEVVNFISNKYPDKKVGILCTNGTHKTGIYRKALEKDDFRTIEPDPEWQERVHQAVYREEYGIKTNSSPVTQKARLEILEAIGHLKEKGAEVIILGCTELPLAITEYAYKEVILVDPNRVLAKALLKWENKLFP